MLKIRNLRIYLGSIWFSWIMFVIYWLMCDWGNSKGYSNTIGGFLLEGITFYSWPLIPSLAFLLGGFVWGSSAILTAYLHLNILNNEVTS